MRIRWTSVPKVVGGNPIAPWVGPGVAERMKDESRNDGRRNEGQEKSDRSRKAWARIIKKEETQ